MNHLFFQTYLDEDVDVLVATLLRSRGFTVRTTLEADMLAAADDAQLAYAASNEMALLTHNRVHFEQLAVDWLEQQRQHWGILIAVRRTPHEIASRLLQILDQTTADEMKNQVRYL